MDLSRWKLVACYFVLTAVCAGGGTLAEAQIVIVIPQPGWGWEIEQTSPEVDSGRYGNGYELQTVENEDYVVSVCRTKPYFWPFAIFPGGNYLHYRKIEKSTGNVVSRVFDIGPAGFRGMAECSITLSHEGDEVLLATNQIDDQEQAEWIWVVRMRLSDDAEIFQRRYRFDSDDIHRFTGIEILHAYTDTGAPNGYNIVGSGNAIADVFGIGHAMFAIRISESGIDVFNRADSVPYEVWVTDADVFNRRVRMTGHNDAGDIVVLKINTTTGVVGQPSVFSIDGHELHDPTISMRVDGGALRGYYLHFSRDDGAFNPIALRARNSGTVVWSRRLRDCDAAIGIVATGSNVYALAHVTNSPAGEEHYKRFVLDEATGDVNPGSIAATIRAPLVAYSFDQGYQGRFLITANDFTSNPNDEWAVYKENAAFLIGYSNSYDCPVVYEYESTPRTVVHDPSAHGYWTPGVTDELHPIDPLEPELWAEDCDL